MAPWSPQITTLVGRFANASNATLLATTDDGTHVVYKPHAGEQPLWDFPPESLAIREVLTYRLSEAMGLGVVPETVIANGPYGPGSVQRYVDVDETFDVVAAVEANDERLWPLAILDIVANNADRKLGHIVRVGDGLIGIDHGLTFHPHDKLRTVLWGFAGRPLPTRFLDGLEGARRALLSDLGDDIELHLGIEEHVTATERVERLLRDGTHPQPPRDRPPVPWPPY